MFPKNQRITKEKEFNNVFRFGRSYYTNFLDLRILKNDLNINRFGFVVSKKISNKAVIRNKIKRHLRAILKKHQEKFPASVDVVIYTKPSINRVSFLKIEEAILNICAKIDNN